MKKFILYYSLSILSLEGAYSQIDISEAVINNTTRIVCFKDTVIDGKKERIKGIGTGFYFCFTNNEDTLSVIVTNKHVINNYQTGYLRFKPFNSITEGVTYGDIMEIKIDNFDSKWIKHPSEDLAISPLNSIFEEVYKKYKKVIGTFKYDESYIPSDQEYNDLSAIEEIVMIGYPKGLADELNDLPIVRKGLTATPVFLNYQNDKQFLLLF